MPHFNPSGFSAIFDSLINVRDAAMRLEKQYIHEMDAYVDDFRAASDTSMTEDTAEEEEHPDEDHDEGGS